MAHACNDTRREMGMRGLGVVKLPDERSLNLCLRVVKPSSHLNIWVHTKDSKHSWGQIRWMKIDDRLPAGVERQYIFQRQ